LGTIEGYRVFMANTSWSNSNEVKFIAKGNHSTRSISLLLSVCGFFGNEKSSFVLCPIAHEVWSRVHRWFGFSTILPDTILSLFESFLVPLRKGKFGCKGVLMVWHAVIWTLWRTRNERIFSNVMAGIEDIVERIKYVS
jgi:hypothetical protein